jgi:hypothetical protein
VHSGSANAGHYWSYIDTLRQKDYSADFQESKEFEENEHERWMEFNDSIVRDFNIAKLKEECYGGDQTTSTSQGFGMSTLEGWSFGGSNSFGKSGYMLFYEKKKKKPLKIVEPSSDEQERVVEIDYSQCVLPTDHPNRIFQQVIEDNLKLTFENDIYTKDFFDFSIRIQQAIL